MIETIEQFLSINYKGVIIALIVLVVVLVGGKELFSKFFTMFGIEFKWKREKEEELKRLDDIERRLDILEKDKEDKDNFRELVNSTLTSVSSSLDIISSELSNLSSTVDKQSEKIDKSNKTTLEFVGDRLTQRLNYFLQIKFIPADEIDSLNEQYDSWVKLGGTNHGIEPKYKYVINNLPIKKTNNFYILDDDK